MLISETPVPPRGWNSYDSFLGAITEADANANLDHFIEKLKPHGYEYFCIDAGWYFDGTMNDHIQMRADNQFRPWNVNEYGCYTPSPVNFPHGLKVLADRCHKNGVKFGVHMMRGMPLPALKLNTPVKGTPYFARDIYDPDHFCSWCQYWVATRADHPGTLAFYRSEVEYLTEEIGVDFIKLDDVTEHPEHIALFAEAVDSVERPVLLSLSPGGEVCPENWSCYRKCANMVRISRDIWDTDAENLLRLQKWYEFQGLGGRDLWLDLDMLPLGAMMVNVEEKHPYGGGFSRQSRMTPRGKETMMTIMAMSCSPLIFGGDLTQTPQADIDYAVHPEVLACSTNGVVGKRVSFQHHADIRKVQRKDDPQRGWIGVFPISARHYFFTPQLFGFDRMPRLYDVWHNRPLKTNADGNLECYLDDMECLFIKYEF